VALYFAVLHLESIGYKKQGKEYPARQLRLVKNKGSGMSLRRNIIHPSLEAINDGCLGSVHRMEIFILAAHLLANSIDPQASTSEYAFFESNFS